MPAPSAFRRFACEVYETLLLLALLFIAGLPFGFLVRSLPHETNVWLTQLYWFLVAGGYFMVFWRRGQTLAMRTWRIRVVSAAGLPLTPAQAIKRFLLACLLFPLSWAWLSFDRERQFLHDRLGSTRLVSVVPSTR